MSFTYDDLGVAIDQMNSFTDNLAKEESYSYSFGQHTHVWTGTQHHIILPYLMWENVTPGVASV